MADLWDALHAAIDAHQPDRIDPGDNPPAAVLIPLLPLDEPHVVLTVRSHLVEHHKGEISFPGGMYETDDRDLQATALREAHEEVGIHPAHVRVLGEVSHLVTITNFHVTPYVGLLDRAPYPFVASALEVGEVLQVPLSHLLDPTNHAVRIVERNGRRRELRDYLWNDHVIWGATGIMLRRLLEEVSLQLGQEH
jgi:8-oxo-dGTP pyrophosphatase MutT (NUDIX family)